MMKQKGVLKTAVVYLHSKGYLLKAAYEGRELLKSLGGKWDATARGWLLPRNFDAVALKAAMPLAFADEAAERAFTELEAHQKEVLELHSAEDADVEHGAGLDGYQRVGLKFLTSAKRALLAYDLGLGKTAIAVRAAREVQAKRVLVITKKSLIYQWAREIERWS